MSQISFNSIGAPGFAGGTFYLPGTTTDPGFTPLIPSNGGSGLYDTNRKRGASAGGMVYNTFYAVPSSAIRRVKPYLVFYTYYELSDGSGGWVRLEDDEIRGVSTFEMTDGPWSVKLTPNTYAALVALGVVLPNASNPQHQNAPLVAVKQDEAKTLTAASALIGNSLGVLIIGAVIIGGIIIWRKVR